MKQTYTVFYPELNNKRKEPLTEEQIQKNKEYSEIKRRRTRDAAMKKMVDDENFKQFTLTRTRTPDTPDTDNSYKTAGTGTIYQSLTRYCIRTRNLKNLPSKFLIGHPVLKGEDYYKTIPIYMSVNMVPYNKCIQPLIFGYLRGVHIADDNKNIEAIIHPSVTQETLEWIYRTHSYFELCIDYDGTFFLDPKKRVRDPKIPILKNPINNRVYSEVETIALQSYLSKQKRWANKVRSLNKKLSDVVDKLSVVEHKYNSYQSTSSDAYFKLDAEVAGLKKEVDSYRNKIKTYEKSLKDIAEAIAQFHIDHEKYLEGMNYSIVWNNTEEVYSMDNTGVITEQGDLGLGFEPISEEDKKKLKVDTEKTSN